MKTSVAVCMGSLAGFVVAFAVVPRRAPGDIPPAWFELPGTPVTVDGKPVEDWEQANRVLRAAAYESYQESCMQSPTRRPVESEGREVRITFRPNGGGGRGGAEQSVVVRTFLPIAIDYSRASPMQLLRYEIARPDVVQ